MAKLKIGETKSFRNPRTGRMVKIKRMADGKTKILKG